MQHGFCVLAAIDPFDEGVGLGGLLIAARSYFPEKRYGATSDKGLTVTIVAFITVAPMCFSVAVLPAI